MSSTGLTMSRRSVTPRRAAAVIVAVAIGLTIAYFPAMFSQMAHLDDEGAFLVMLRTFLHHGGIYEDTFTIHGPFYFMFMSPLYWLTGQDPTLDNGRIIVLLLTALSAGLFSCAVWRVTKSLAWTLFCEIGVYLLLVTGNFREPMHPGSLVVLLLAVLSVALASHAVTNSTASLAMVGGTVGALLMTKINIGFFALGALLLAFMVGNRSVRPKVQVAVVAIAVIAPFLIIHDNIWAGLAVAIAVLVSVCVLVLAVVSLRADEVALPRRGLIAAGVAVGVVVSACLVFAIATGTSLTGLYRGMAVVPMRVPQSLLIQPSNLLDDWAAIAAMVAGAGALLTVRRLRIDPTSRPHTISWPHALLAGGGIWLFGVGVAQFGDFSTWLPLVVLVPGLAVVAGARSEVRFALRALVPVAVLQVLHVYPVAGSQAVWATVALAVPCTIAIAAGTDGLLVWAYAGRAGRGITVGALVLVFMVGMSLWPPTLWQTYRDQESVDLPGARLLHLTHDEGARLRAVTRVLRTHCDALWFSPYSQGSFVVFSGVPIATGAVQNFFPGRLLDSEQQRRAVKALEAREARGDRVCTVVDTSSQFPPLRGAGNPLPEFVDQYTKVIGTAGRYEVRVRDSSS